MDRRNILGLLLIVYSYFLHLEASFVPEDVYFADGGGSSSPVECILGGEVKFDDETYFFSTTGCENVTDTRPFRGFELLPPTDGNTDVTKWCPIANPYNAKSIADPPTKRQQWGYCLTRQTTQQPSTSPTASPTTPAPTPFVSEQIWYADGAGVGFNEPGNVLENGFQHCIFPFTFRDSDGTETVHESCASIIDHVPFHSTNTFPEPPTDPNTDTSLWCAINRDLYEKVPATQTSLRKDWGYCLGVWTTQSPTTSPTKNPTKKPTTSPTQNPTTLTPTKNPTSSPTLAPTRNITQAPTTGTPTTTPTNNPTSSPTGTPTKYPTVSPTSNPTKIPTSSPTRAPSESPTMWSPVITYYGVGGGLRSNQSLECSFPFTWEGSDQLFNRCLSFDEYEPWGWSQAYMPDLLPQHELNISLWCAVNSSIYVPVGAGRRDWGFCSMHTSVRNIFRETLSPTVDDDSSAPRLRFNRKLMYLLFAGAPFALLYILK